MRMTSGRCAAVAVSACYDLESGMAEEIADDPPIVLLVFDNKNAFCHPFPTCLRDFEEEVEPAPSSDSTQE
jgi:hypothetical protein